MSLFKFARALCLWLVALCVVVSGGVEAAPPLAEPEELTNAEAVNPRRLSTPVPTA